IPVQSSLSSRSFAYREYLLPARWAALERPRPGIAHVPPAISAEIATAGVFELKKRRISSDTSCEPQRRPRGIHDIDFALRKRHSDLYLRQFCADRANRSPVRRR